MRDLIFGNVALATKTVEVYTANSVNFGASDARLADTELRVGEQHDYRAVVQLNADLPAADTVDTIKFEHSDDGSTWVKLLGLPDIAASTKKGVVWSGQFPTRHKQHVRLAATPQSSGTFTANTLTVWCEPAPNV